MSFDQVHVRAAKPGDAEAIAGVHDRAWRGAYRGIIPGLALERMVERRGPGWWKRLVRQRHGVLVLEVHGKLAGYATFGGNRSRNLRVRGEIYELYLDPPYQGIGLGRVLFEAARDSLKESRCKDFVVWVLEANEMAVGFYQAMGGEAVAHGTERFGASQGSHRQLDVLTDQESCHKLAFVWGSS